MKSSYRIFLFLLWIFFSMAGFCQLPAIESARQKVYAAATDAERLLTLEAIGKYRNSLPADTLYQYAQWMKKIAVDLNDNKHLLLAGYNLLTGDLVKGKTDSVVYKIDNTEIFKTSKSIDLSIYYKLQFLKANALNRLNKRTEALDLQLKLLTEAEKEGNISSQLYALNYIGATYINVGKPLDAKKMWEDGLQRIKNSNNDSYLEIEAYILSNLALYYFNIYAVTPAKQISDSFFYAINKTISISAKIENLGLLASALSLRGKFYGSLQQFEKGEKDINDGLAHRKQIGDPLYIMNDFITLSDFYLSQKQYQKCIEAANEGITLANNNGIRGEQIQLISILATAYKNSGDYKGYSTALEQFMTEADNSNKLNAADKIAEIQTKYEVQKKETLIAQQKLGLFQRKLLLYGAGILALVTSVFFIYRFKKYQHKQKRITEEKRMQNEFDIKDAEEKERKRIAAELHDNLGVQANAILHNSRLLNEENVYNKPVVQDLQETAKEMLLNLRETLWAMKTNDVTPRDLWLRIINFMQQMGKHYTTINFAIVGAPPEGIIISSARALNIVLVLQETVNNAVKYAAAKTIIAKSIVNNNNWQLVIEDDGMGFNIAEAKQKNDSYGLTNMEERAKSGSFNYSIESELAKGTRTMISITN